MAAAKSANPVTLPQVMAAGIFVSGCVLVIGGLQLAELFGWLVPPPVIRGVQLGVGLNVAIKVGACTTCWLASLQSTHWLPPLSSFHSIAKR